MVPANPKVAAYLGLVPGTPVIQVHRLRFVEEVPIILVANKIDLKEARSKKVRDAFPQYDFVEISAATGENMGQLYSTIAKKL